MLVNFKINAKKGIRSNDLIIAKEDGSFELISKDEFLKTILEDISKHDEEIELMKNELQKQKANVNSLYKKITNKINL